MKLKQIALWAGLFLLADGLCTALPALHIDEVSYPFQMLAPLAALCACIWQARRVTERSRSLWLLLAGGLACWSVGIGLSAWEDMFRHIPFDTAFFSDFAFFFYGVPLLFALSRPVESPRYTLFTVLDGIQAAFAGYLTYLTIFAELPFTTGVMHPMSINRLVTTYDVENVVLAIFCGVRLLASRMDSEVKRFYQALVLYLVTYAVLAGIYNHAAVAMADHSPPDTLMVAPFVLLTVLILRQSTGAQELEVKTPQPGALGQFIDNASPILFTLALLALGLMVLRTRFVTGIVAVSVALAVYCVRTTLLQTRYLRVQQELTEARDRLEALSLLDGLTGIANRRCFDQRLDMEWHRAARNKEPLALVMMDLDRFKNLNDTQGHPAGDRCLIEVAQMLQRLAGRSSDLVARYGGEEFAVILPGTSLDAAVKHAERMHRAIGELEIVNETAHGRHLTASFGVAASLPQPEESYESLIHTADRTLYRAKELGRDRVERAK